MSPAEHALRAQAQAWRAEGRAAAVVTLAEVRGSVPRAAGTRMLVTADAVAGTIGGGHLEFHAIAQARQALAGGAWPAPERVALGPALGQCCGGWVRLHYGPLVTDDPAAWHGAPPRFALQLHGAGHVGRAVAALLGGIACTVQWVDERDAEFPAAPPPPHIEVRRVGDAVAELADAPPGARVLVMTHNHALDLELCAAALRRDDLPFIGLIGSATKRARFLARLGERGFGEAALARLHCPVGLPGIDGKEPEVIAVAVVAQLLAGAPPVDPG